MNLVQKQAYIRAGNGPVGFADLKTGFLSDSLRESPQKIGIADRPEAELKALRRIKLSLWAGKWR